MNDLVFDDGANRFNVRVAAIIIENNHLLVMNDFHAAYLYLPGGRIQYGEESKTALKREIKEELHMECRVHHLQFIAENFFEENTLKKIYHELCFFYHVELNGSVEDRQMIDGVEYRWIDLEDLASVEFEPHDLIPRIAIPSVTTQHLIIKK